MAGGGALRLALLAGLLLGCQGARAAAEQELRFKPAPRDRPVRLFTEAELARYDGQEVGERAGQECPLAGRIRRWKLVARLMGVALTLDRRRGWGTKQKPTKTTATKPPVHFRGSFPGRGAWGCNPGKLAVQ